MADEKKPAPPGRPFHTKNHGQLSRDGTDVANPAWLNVLQRVEGVKHTGPGKCVALCPAHPDRTPSLSVSVGDGGRVLLHCWAGCSTDAVVQSLGLSWRDLFPEGLTPGARIEYRRQTLQSSRDHAAIVLNVYQGMVESGEEIDEADEVLAAKCQQDLPRIEAELETLDPAPVPLLPEFDLSDVMSAEPEQGRFVVDPWLPRGYVTLMGGHGAIGKSMLALALAAHIAAGRPYALKPVDRAPVLYVSLEDDPAPVRVRLRNIIEAHNLPADRVLENLRALDGTRGPSALITAGDGYNGLPLFTPALKRLEQAAQGVGLVIIDNASDAFDCNENARRDVRAFMRRLYQLAQANDCAVLLLNHIDKAAARNGAQGNSYSGSTAWHNSARSRLALVNESRDGAPEQIVLRHEKASHSVCADPVYFDRDPSGVLVPQLPKSFAERALTGDDFDQAQIIRAMRAAGEAGINVRSSIEPGAYSAMKSLEAMAEYESTFGGNGGNKRAARAIAALIRRGIIRIETFTGPHRKTRERLVLSESAPNPDRVGRVSTPERRINTPQNTPKKVRRTPPHTPPMGSAHPWGAAPTPASEFGAGSAQTAGFGAEPEPPNTDPEDFRDV